MPEMQYNGELKEILQRLARIEQQITDLDIPDPVACALHASDLVELKDQLRAIKAVQGKQHLLVLSLGAIGSGIALAVKYFFAR